MVLIFLIGVAIVICLTACSSYIEKQIIFRPIKLDKNYQYEFKIPFQEFNFISDGDILNALYFASNLDTIMGTIIYYHGNSRNLSHWGKNAALFTQKGYEVFFYDYPQYGKSEGLLNEERLYSDALNFYDEVMARKSKETNNIILYGRSLGTTFASYAATKRSAVQLILETPFNNMPTMFIMKAPFQMNLIKNTFIFPTDQFLPKITYPIHIIHGDKDEVVPYESAKLLEPILQEKDSFTTILKGKHRNLADFDSFHKIINQLL